MFTRHAPTMALITVLTLLVACSPAQPTPTAPTVALSASATSVLAPTTVTLNANASSSRGIAVVTFFKNGSQVAQSSAAPYSATVPITAADVPSVSFTAQACDPQGLCSTSSAAGVSVSASSGPNPNPTPTPNPTPSPNPNSTPTPTPNPIPSPTPDFSLSASPATLALSASQSASSAITINRSGGFSGDVTLSVGTLPSGVTYSVTGTTVTFTASSAATNGTTQVIITGIGGGLSHQTQITLQVNAQATSDFNLSASPAALNVTQGGTAATNTITVTKSGSFSGDVTLSVSGAPSGLSATLSGTTLTVQANGSLATGSYPLTITGTSGSVSHTTGVNVQVTSNTNSQAPTVQFVPTTPTNVTGGVAVPFSFKLHFTNATSAQLYRDGMKLQVQPNVAVPDNVYGDLYQFTRDNGNYTYTVKAFNDAGQETHASLTISVNLTTSQDCTGSAFPSSTPCAPRNSVEDSWLTQINEIRTQGTLNGTTDALKGTCADPATSQAGHLPAYQYEGHLNYAARQHANYMTQNNVSGTLDEDYTKPGFYGLATIDRLWHAGISDGGRLYYEGNLLAQDNNFVQSLLSTPQCSVVVSSTYTYIGLARATMGRTDYALSN